MSSQISVGRKVMVVVALSLALICFGLTWFLDARFYQTRPREPRHLEGRIYQTKVHRGALVYVTLGEQLALYCLSPLGVLFAIIAAVIYDRRPKRLNGYGGATG